MSEERSQLPPSTKASLPPVPTGNSYLDALDRALEDGDVLQALRLLLTISKAFQNDLESLNPAIKAYKERLQKYKYLSYLGTEEFSKKIKEHIGTRYLKNRDKAIDLFEKDFVHIRTIINKIFGDIPQNDEQNDDKESECLNFVKSIIEEQFRAYGFQELSSWAKKYNEHLKREIRHFEDVLIIENGRCVFKGNDIASLEQDLSDKKGQFEAKKREWVVKIFRIKELEKNKRNAENAFAKASVAHRDKIEEKSGLPSWEPQEQAVISLWQELGSYKKGEDPDNIAYKDLISKIDSLTLKKNSKIQQVDGKIEELLQGLSVLRDESSRISAKRKEKENTLTSLNTELRLQQDRERETKEAIEAEHKKHSTKREEYDAFVTRNGSAIIDYEKNKEQLIKYTGQAAILPLLISLRKAKQKADNNQITAKEDLASAGSMFVWKTREEAEAAFMEAQDEYDNQAKELSEFIKVISKISRPDALKTFIGLKEATIEAKNKYKEARNTLHNAASGGAWFTRHTLDTAQMAFDQAKAKYKKALTSEQEFAEKYSSITIRHKENEREESFYSEEELQRLADREVNDLEIEHDNMLKSIEEIDAQIKEFKLMYKTILEEWETLKREMSQTQEIEDDTNQSAGTKDKIKAFSKQRSILVYREKNLAQKIKQIEQRLETARMKKSILTSDKLAVKGDDTRIQTDFEEEKKLAEELAELSSKLPAAKEALDARLKMEQNLKTAEQQLETAKRERQTRVAKLDADIETADKKQKEKLAACEKITQELSDARGELTALQEQAKHAYATVVASKKTLDQAEIRLNKSAHELKKKINVIDELEHVSSQGCHLPSSTKVTVGLGILAENKATLSKDRTFWHKAMSFIEWIVRLGKDPVIFKVKGKEFEERGSTLLTTLKPEDSSQPESDLSWLQAPSALIGENPA